MQMPHLLVFCLLLSSMNQQSEGNSQNRGALQESFVIKLKTLKEEYEANTADLLAVINNLQQNINTTLIKDLKDETQSLHIQLNKTIEEQEGTIKELKKTVEGHQLAIVQSYTLVAVFNRTIMEQRSTIQHLQKTIEDQQLMIDRLNLTDVKNVKEDVEVLETVMEEQRLMIQHVNLSRRSSKGLITLSNIINIL